MADRKEISCEIVEHIGVISTSTAGWTKELNLIRWNGNSAKYDVREWQPGREKMSKGITLTDAEAQQLCELLDKHLE